MTDLFDEEEVVVDESFGSDEKLPLDVSGDMALDARRRLEKLLEEKRLQAELDDFGGF